MKRTPVIRPTRPSRHRGRVMLLQGLLLTGLVTVVARLAQVQHSFGPILLSQAKEAEVTTQVLLAPRGAILDASGHPLAYDVPAFMLDIKAGAFPDKVDLARRLAPALQTPENDLLPLLSGPYVWVRWPNPVLEPAKQKVLSALRGLKDKDGHLAVQDVTFTPTEERFYPDGTFAANVIGYVDHEGNGLGGIEAEYNDLLAGHNGLYAFTRDGDGFPIQSSIKVLAKARPGKDVQLTIDPVIQGFVEHEMNNLVRKYHPAHAAIIVTNPNTGAVLGMASRPTFDPNHYAQANRLALSNNWAVNTAFEPGSTFKVLTLAAALATHAVSLDQTFLSGHMTVAGHRINDWNYKGWGVINFRQALEYSSNVGFATIALRLGWPNLLHYMKVFGYLDKTGIDLPAEANSLVFPPSQRGEVQLATSGFGQGIAVTPMQQVAAIGAIANGGRLLRPYVMQKVIDPATGKVVKENKPTVVNPQVVPPDVIKQLQRTLVLDVSEGIDKTGYLPGYDVAGKTGTANVVDPKTGKYYKDRFIVSFIGYAPGWDPKVEVYVTVYWPKTQVWNEWGSTIATPVARNLLQECLQYYRIPPRGGADISQTQQTPAGGQVKYVETPNLIGQTASAAAVTGKKSGLTVQPVGGPGEIVRQWPAPGVEVPVGSSVFVATQSGPAQNILMPDLAGVSLRDAGNMLAALGLKLHAEGDGYAVSQSVPPGQTVQPGETVTVRFAQPAASTGADTGNGQGNAVHNPVRG